MSNATDLLAEIGRAPTRPADPDRIWAHARRRTRRRRVLGTGVVAALAAGVAFNLLPPTRTDGPVVGDLPTTCATAAELRATGDSPVDVPLEGDDIDGWALLMTPGDPAWRAGLDTKVVVSLSGGGPLTVEASGPGGQTVEPTSGPTAVVSSSWDRPGDEFHQFLTLPAPGCWTLRFDRRDGSASLRLQVEPVPRTPT